MNQATYIDRAGRERIAYNTLTPEREIELRKHLDDCNVACQQCPECWLLYCNIGQEKYCEALTREML